MRIDAQIPKVLGGYRLIRLLGRGGMAEVWLANKIGDPLEKPWVVKVLLPEHTSSAKHRERFLAEVKTLASLRHGRIVPIHAFGEDQGFLYLVMEYIDGVNLRVFVKGLATHGERLPIAAVIFIVAEIADALRHAHSRTRPGGGPRGVIHRDVNPSNVLISSEGEVFLTDFGLARYEQDFSMEMFGTTAYVAPEQARGAACAQSDLYGLGASLHFMLTGEPPRSVSAAELHKVLDDPPPPIGRDDVPELLHRIHALALAPLLADRFESAADILGLIEAHKEYQRATTLLAQLHLRHFGPPKTGMTEALAMATAAPSSTVPLAPPPRPKVDLSPKEDEVTTFWQPPSPSPSPRPEPDEPLVEKVPPEYRPAPGRRVEADAPKVRRRPRRDGSEPPEPPRPEPTEILPKLFDAERRPTTERSPKDTAPPEPEPVAQDPAAASTRSSTAPSRPPGETPSASASAGAQRPVEPAPASPPSRDDSRPKAVEVLRTPGRAVPMRQRRRTFGGSLMATTAVACVAALGVAFTRGELEPRPGRALPGQGSPDEAPPGRHDAFPAAGAPSVDDGDVALGSAARSEVLAAAEAPEQPEVLATAPSTTQARARELGPTIPVVVVIGGIEGGEVEVGDERLPLDPIAHTALPPGRYPLRWRNSSSAEWQDAGTVHVTPEDVQDGLLRVQVSPTEWARVEPRP
jgi:eukaryotic-like serine/threonine-protein kinase